MLVIFLKLFPSPQYRFFSSGLWHIPEVCKRKSKGTKIDAVLYESRSESRRGKEIAWFCYKCPLSAAKEKLF